MKRMTRALLTLVLTMAGAAFAQTTVTMWDFLAGGDGARMGQIVDGFNKSQNDVQIERTTLEWGVPFYTKVRTSIIAGQQPDVMTYHLSRFPDAVAAGLLCTISDSDLSSVGLSTDQFLPLLVDKATVDGQLYGLPLDTHPLVLYYNKDLLAEAGQLNADGSLSIDGIDEFTAMMTAVNKATGAYGLAFEVDGSMPWRLWYSLVRQQGGEAIRDGELVYGAEGREALERMVDWAEAGLMARNIDYPSSVALFTSGRAAFSINGVWEVPTLVDTSASGELPFEFGVMPLPVFYDQAANWADSHAFALPCSDKSSLSDAKKAAVLQFLSYVAENSLIWGSGGHIPAYLPVLESEDYLSLEPNSDFASAGDWVVYDPDSIIAGAAGPLQDATTQYFVPAINGQISIDQALEMFDLEIEALLMGQ